MTKLVINRSYGGFGLSSDAIELYAKKKGIQLYKINNKYGNLDFYTDPSGESGYFSYYEIKRDDPVLIEVVQEIGDKASSIGNKLRIVEIPDDVEWEIGEYDGLEWVAEKHRVWYGDD